MAKISAKNTAEAIYASARGKSGVELDTVMRNSVEFMAGKKLLSKAPEVLRELARISDAEEGIVRATVFAPSMLTDNTKKEIERILKERHRAKSVILDFREDKTLLGGMRIETGDEVTDLTLKNRVSQLQDHLLKN